MALPLIHPTAKSVVAVGQLLEDVQPRLVADGEIAGAEVGGALAHPFALAAAAELERLLGRGFKTRRDRDAVRGIAGEGYRGARGHLDVGLGAFTIHLTGELRRVEGDRQRRIAGIERGGELL